MFSQRITLLSCLNLYLLFERMMHKLNEKIFSLNGTFITNFIVKID